MVEKIKQEDSVVPQRLSVFSIGGWRLTVEAPKSSDIRWFGATEADILITIQDIPDVFTQVRLIGKVSP